MRRLVSPALGLGAVLGLLAAAGDARAEPPPPRTSALSWTRLDGAGACVGIHELARAVEQRLRRDVFVPPAHAGVSVEAWIEPAPAPDRWRAVLQLSDTRGVVLGTRELRSDAPSCRALDAQLALVIAVLIDPDAALGGPPPAPPPASAPSPPPAQPGPGPTATPSPSTTPGDARLPSAPPPPTLAAPPPAWSAPAPAWSPPARARPAPPLPRTPWIAGVEAGPAFAFGMLPGTGVGIQLRAQITPPRWPTFELGAATWLPDEARAGALGVRLSLTDAFLSVCPLNSASGGVGVAACAGLRAGFLRAVGFGFDHALDGDQAVFDVTAEARVRSHLVGPVVATWGLGLLVPATRYRFSYQAAAGQAVDVFRMWPIAAILDAGVGLEFF